MRTLSKYTLILFLVSFWHPVATAQTHAKRTVVDFYFYTNHPDKTICKLIKQAYAGSKDYEVICETKSKDKHSKFVFYANAPAFYYLEGASNTLFLEPGDSLSIKENFKIEITNKSGNGTTYKTLSRQLIFNGTGWQNNQFYTEYIRKVDTLKIKFEYLKHGNEYAFDAISRLKLSYVDSADISPTLKKFIQKDILYEKVVRQFKLVWLKYSNGTALDRFYKQMGLSKQTISEDSTLNVLNEPCIEKKIGIKALMAIETDFETSFYNRLKLVQYNSKHRDEYKYILKKKLQSRQQDFSIAEISKACSFIDTLPLNDDGAYYSFWYHIFIKQKIKRILYDPNFTFNDPLQTLKDSSTFNPGYYHIASALLKGKNRELYLYELLSNHLGPYENKSVQPYIDLYANDYGKTKYTSLLFEKLKNTGTLIPGAPAIDFEYENAEGEKSKLSQYWNGIVYVVCSSRANFKPNIGSDITSFDSIARLYEPKGITCIYIYNGANKSEYFKFVTKNKLRGIFLYNVFDINSPYIEKDLSYNSSKKYFESNTQYLISNGRIFKSGRSLNYYLHSSLYQAIKQYPTVQPKQTNLKLILISIALILFTIALLSFYLWLWKRIVRRREERKRRRLEGELRSIRSQMNPHFMFNSLGSIQNLVNKNQIAEANLYLSKFAGLMRKILENSEKTSIPLANELEAVRTYCELETLRFGFDYELIVSPNIDIHNTEIPGMIVQPFVENAILHGINHLVERKGKISIDVLKLHHHIQIVITDNGIGREASAELKAGKLLLTQSTGKGMALIQERMDILSRQLKKKHTLEIADLTDAEGMPSGTRVTITIPEEE